ncbi:MAG TPA: type II 3-dehydroquinate dehydratase [Acidimicrobiia bacterium]
MNVLFLHGPNLNLLGRREPEVYGTTTLPELEARITTWGGQLGVTTTFRQSNHEGDLVDAIQAAGDLDGIVINPGALTHTSRSIGDALRSVGVPAVEVHISNVKAREEWRSVSFISDAAVRTIYGRGFTGYRDALRHLVNRDAVPFSTLRYGPHQDNVADVRFPTGGSRCLVVLIHGGFWLQEWERDSMETLAVDLTLRGHVTMNVEYRRLGTGGGWPGSAHDVLTVLEHAALDTQFSTVPAAVMGHSAGGHLALWAAGRVRTRPVDLTIGLAPVTDLAVLADLGAAGGPQARQLLQAGAQHRIVEATGSTLLVHGLNDDLVPTAHSTRLEDTANVALVPGLGHFELLDPHREHWTTVIDALDRLD